MIGSPPFRVIIVGGSVAGLALAVMLENQGIDFVLLEAYPEISPQVGAQIAVLANGNRILDQLGVYENLLRRAQYCVDDFHLRDSDGKSLAALHEFGDALIQRHGYPMYFLDRQMLLEELHKHIKDKSKVLVSKRVVHVEESEKCVTASTADGSVYQGDIIVGADGFHSTVKQETYRMNSKSKIAGAEGSEPEDLPAEYAALFGISTGECGIPKSAMNIVTGKNSTHLVSSGPDDKSYWCMFYHLGNTYYGKDAKPFQEEDLVRKHWDDKITETVKFSDLYEKRISSIATPLHEGTAKHWHSSRCVLIGDSCHKFHPFAGQGGNSAIESAAALTNAVVRLLHSAPPHQPITPSDLSALFASVHSLRAPRIAELLKISSLMQKMCAVANPVLRWLLRWTLPVIGAPVLFHLLTVVYPDAVSLDMLPIPERPRKVAYVDELARTRRGERGFTN